VRALSDTDRTVLAVAEALPALPPERRRMAIWTRLPGWSQARFHQWLNALIDDPDARAQAPVILGRLERLRHRRRAER
jgi:hypothetical protein